VILTKIRKSHENPRSIHVAPACFGPSPRGETSREPCHAPLWGAEYTPRRHIRGSWGCYERSLTVMFVSLYYGHYEYFSICSRTSPTWTCTETQSWGSRLRMLRLFLFYFLFSFEDTFDGSISMSPHYIGCAQLWHRQCGLVILNSVGPVLGEHASLLVRTALRVVGPA
jgi:hypothetical protein